MHEMSVMTHEGDTKCYWDPNNPESVKVASETFAAHAQRGYRAFSMVGTQGTIMDVFDPNAAQILFVPAMQGG